MAEINYLRNNQTNLLDVLSISLGVNREEARFKAKLIANSYNSAKVYTGSDEKAAEMIVQGSKSAFGVEINGQILDTALAYVKKFENNNDSITATRRLGDNNRRRIRISELEERAITPLNTSYIAENEAQYRARTDNGKSYGAKVIPINRGHNNVEDTVKHYRPSREVVASKRAPLAASIAFFAYFLNPFSGLVHSPTSATDVYAQTATVQAQREKLEYFKKMVADKKEPEAKSQIAAPAVQPEPQIVQAPAPNQPQPAQSVAPTPTQAVAKQTTRRVYEHETEEHRKFRKHEIPYKDLSDKAKAWFGLRHPIAELKQEGDKFFMYVTVPYKGPIGDKAGVKAADRWYSGFKPNEVYKIELTESQFNNVKSRKRPAQQAMVYQQEQNLERVLTSLNYERPPKKAQVAKAPKVEKPIVAEAKPSIEKKLKSSWVLIQPEHITE